MISAGLQAGYYDGVDAVAKLKASSYYNFLMNAYSKLRTDLLYKSRVHGISHIERVMLLGAIVAMQQRFSVRETELLLFACSYHDIGRENDWRDDRHGKRGADMLASIPFPEISADEMKSIQTAIATHSTKDAYFEFFADEYQVPREELKLCHLLCMALKDADNLDRVRIHDLDVKHLRFDESKTLKPAAESIYRLSKQ